MRAGQRTGRRKASSPRHDDAEHRPCFHLRNRAFPGCKFRRQVPVGPYVADLACIEASLIIDLDCGQHAKAALKNAMRTAHLQSAGYRVVRFWNNDVLTQAGAVLGTIHEALAASPHPNPRPQAGEGAQEQSIANMPNPLRIALAQFDFPVGAVQRNAERIAAMIEQARDEYGADVVLFPELALSGYPPEDLLLRPSFLADCQAEIERIAAGVRDIVAVVGWPQAAGSVVYNAASVCATATSRTPIASGNCPTTRCSTNAATSMSTPIATTASLTSMACRSAC